MNDSLHDAVYEALRRRKEAMDEEMALHDLVMEEAAIIADLAPGQDWGCDTAGPIQMAKFIAESIRARKFNRS